MCVNTACSTGI